MPFFGRVVGLTGGKSSGKSTVSDLFKDRGIPVVDANFFSNAALNRGTVVYTLVVSALGSGILRNDREIHRRRLMEAVSSDTSRRQLFDGYLAAYMMFKVFWELVRLWMEGHRLIVVDAPLLIEYKLDRLTDQIIVVWTTRQTQIERLMAREGVSVESAWDMIDAEMSLGRKKTKASWTIVNNGSLDDLDVEFLRVFDEVTQPLTWFQLLFSSLKSSFWIACFICISILKALL